METVPILAQTGSELISFKLRPNMVEALRFQRCCDNNSVDVLAINERGKSSMVPNIGIVSSDSLINNYPLREVQMLHAGGVAPIVEYADDHQQLQRDAKEIPC